MDFMQKLSSFLYGLIIYGFIRLIWLLLHTSHACLFAKFGIAIWAEVFVVQARVNAEWDQAEAEETEQMITGTII